MALTTTGRHTPAGLRNLAAQLEESAALMKAAATALEQLQLSELIVTHQNSQEIGWRGVDAFVAALRDAVRAAGTEPIKKNGKREIAASDSRTQRPRSKDLGSTKGRKTDT